VLALVVDMVLPAVDIVVLLVVDRVVPTVVEVVPSVVDVVVLPSVEVVLPPVVVGDVPLQSVPLQFTYLVRCDTEGQGFPSFAALCWILCISLTWPAPHFAEHCSTTTQLPRTQSTGHSTPAAHVVYRVLGHPAGTLSRTSFTCPEPQVTEQLLAGSGFHGYITQSCAHIVRKHVLVSLISLHAAKPAWGLRVRVCSPDPHFSLQGLHAVHVV
jgi:hypothetical protein